MSAVTQTSPLLAKVIPYVQQYMSHYDASHDFFHILRVVGLAYHLLNHPSNAFISSKCNREIIALSTFLHDVGDKKYLNQGEDPATMVKQLLLSFGATEDLSQTVQIICTYVSYSSEIKDPRKVLDVIEQCPELAIVQNADRLDAIGAIGIGRSFTFGSAKRIAGGMEEAIKHFQDKLENLEGMMKTPAGREMAKERTVRLRWFRDMWEAEKRDTELGLESSGLKDNVHLNLSAVCALGGETR